LPITVFVSCDSRKIDFKQCIKQVCDESKGEYEYHHIPDEVAPANEQDRLQRMLDLVRTSDVVFMDVTPTRVSVNGVEQHVTNQGVLIEYGALVSHPPYREKLRVFCEDWVSRSVLHPYFLMTVHSFSTKNLADEGDPQSLRRQVKKMIEDYKKRLPEIARKRAEEIEALKRITGLKKD